MALLPRWAQNIVRVAEGFVSLVINGSEVSLNNRLPVETPVSEWVETGNSAANSPLTVTHAAQVGRRHYLTGFVVVARADAIGASDVRVQITSGSRTLWDDYLGAGAPRGDRTGAVFAVPIQGDLGANIVLTVSAGGGTVVTTGTIAGFSR